MSHAYIIEIGEATAGIVVREADPGHHYRFFASSSRFYALEGRQFSTVEAAHRAASGLLKSRSHPQNRTRS